MTAGAAVRADDAVREPDRGGGRARLAALDAVDAHRRLGLAVERDGRLQRDRVAERGVAVAERAGRIGDQRGHQIERRIDENHAFQGGDLLGA